MFGFACDETEELMPMPIQLAHRLTQRLSEIRKANKVDFLRPDGKSQVTIEYRNGRPVRVDCVVISTQHSEKVSNTDLRDAVTEHVIKPIIPASMLDAKTKYHINPTGRFVIGGPMGDAGLTGRKIIVDTYGGYSRHGGVLSPARIRRRSIVQLAIWRATSQKTSSPLVWRERRKCNWLMLSALPSQCPLWPRLSERPPSRKKESRR